MGAPRAPLRSGWRRGGRVVLGIALGLAASVSWGISDFIGGLQTRRFSALPVLLVSQPVGLVLAFRVALRPPPQRRAGGSGGARLRSLLPPDRAGRRDGSGVDDRRRAGRRRRPA